MPKKGSTFGGPAAVAPAHEEEESSDSQDEPEFTMEELAGALGNPYNQLPPVVRRRVDALQNLHKQYLAVQKQYQAEVAELEKKYAKLYEPIMDKRANVVSGVHEPTDEEARVEKKDEEMEGEENKLREAEPEDANIKGIPEFWLAVMQNNRAVSEAVHEADEEALKYLMDVRSAELEGDKKGFTLTFYFSENPYFSNTTLTKTYFMEEEEIFGELLFEKATGTKIEWKDGKNLTVRQVKKKLKAKGKGKPPRVVTVDQPQDSFFTFFAPPEMNDDTENPEEAAAILEQDFDIGCSFKDKLIPFSYLWFTGEAAEFEDDFDDEFDEEDFDDEEGDEDEDEDEEDEDEPPRKGKGGNKAGHSHSHAHAHPKEPKGGAGAPGQPPQPECKQQ